MRSAKDYLSGLKDGRTIYINGASVSDVTTHHAAISRIRWPGCSTLRMPRKTSI
ncbi:aromatic ring hydroxylase [Bradyrhizobium ottawaense]